MADSAIPSVPIKDDAAPALRVARLSGERYRDSAINNTIRHKRIITIGCTAEGKGYQQRCQ
jgi:hypothetical protein